MNANELAFHSLIVRLIGAGYVEAATVLRQQQAEINSLTEWKNTWLPYLRKHLGVTDL